MAYVADADADTTRIGGEDDADNDHLDCKERIGEDTSSSVVVAASSSSPPPDTAWPPPPPSTVAAAVVAAATDEAEVEESFAESSAA